MNFTDWLKTKLPHLENESSAITFQYIEEAKKSTAKLRMLISLINFILTVMVSYGVGYLLGKYSDVDSGITIAICVVISILVTTRIDKSVKNRIIQKKLLEIAGRNT